MCDMTHVVEFAGITGKSPTLPQTRLNLRRRAQKMSANGSSKSSKQAYLLQKIKLALGCAEGLRDAYRVAKTHRIPYLCRSFSAKVTYI